VRALLGRFVVRPFAGEDGEERTYWGVVQADGSARSAYPFRVVYEDGDSETMSLAELKAYLMPAGTQPPAAVRLRGHQLAAVAVAALSPTMWPETWDLVTEGGARAALGQVMPGVWGAAQLVALVAAAAAPRVRAGVDPAQRAGQRAMVEAHVALGTLRAALDPFWAGHGLAHGVAEALEAVGVPVRALHARQSPLQPATYRQLSSSAGALDAIVGAPPPALLDIALPLAVAYAAQVVLYRVPAAFVLEAPLPRARWMDGLQSSGRLIILQEPPEPRPGLASWLWVVVYSSEAAASWMAGWPDYARARRPGGGRPPSSVEALCGSPPA
jgi:hypothetical protein